MQELAQKIRDTVYKRFVDYKITLFLCGAGKQNKNSMREKVARAFKENWYFYKYLLVYPEDVFEDILSGVGRQDLISLENILADSVDAIIILVESLGAVAELGVFSSHNQLRKKIICIVDENYKKDKSFINMGPIRLMRDRKEGEVIYGDFEDVDEIVKLIRPAINRVIKASKKYNGIKNVLHAHHYVLSCIYLLEPVERALLIDLVKYASETDDLTTKALASGGINYLTNNREIEKTSEGYVLTPLGLNVFSNLGMRGSTRYTFDKQAMDEMRVSILNWQLRGKNLPKR